MIDPNKYAFIVRSDFSMVALPVEAYRVGRPERQCPDMNDGPMPICLRNGACRHKGTDGLCRKLDVKQDRNNSAEDGYRLRGHSKIKIRSAVNALYLSDPDNRKNLRFVTFTFPSLPYSWESLDSKEQDKRLYDLFKKFLNNERNNYKLTRYVWVNERQERGTIHFHCVFQYPNIVSYAQANIRFLNLLRRNGFNIFASGFLVDSYALKRNHIIDRLDSCDYQWFEKNSKSTKFKDKVTNKYGQIEVKERSIFLQPVDFQKPINDVVQLSYYLSKYISKDDEKERVYCRRWASSRGLFEEKDQIFNEFESVDLLELYRDIPAEQKEKGGYKEKELKPSKFNFDVGECSYEGYYFPPVYRKWALDPSIVDYFKNKFNFYLTT